MVACRDDEVLLDINKPPGPQWGCTDCQNWKVKPHSPKMADLPTTWLMLYKLCGGSFLGILAPEAYTFKFSALLSDQYQS